MSWTNRITRTGSADPAGLLAHPDNWRIHPEHQQQVLAGVLGELGWIQHVVVSERSGRIVDGHLRVMLAKASGESAVPVVYVDLDPADEAKALASFDSVAALADLDAGALMRALDQVESASGSLEGFFADLAREATSTLAGLDGGESDEVNRASRLGKIPKRDDTVRLVLSVPVVETFERALRATGLSNRGAALEAICNEYLGAKGQHDAGAQDRAAAQFADAATRAGRGSADAA